MGGRRSGTERDQIWISGLGWYVIRRTTATGGRYGGGSVGRSHRGGTLRVLRPAKYDKSSSLTRVEPPRWFTARRKLVKFKSAFKTGLARCPGPLPAAGTAGERYRRAPTGVYRSNILGKLRMDFPPQPISSGSASNRRFFRASQRVVVRPSVRPFRPVCPFPSPRKLLEQTVPRHQIVTAIIGQDTRRNVTDDVTAGSDAFSSALKLFPRASRRRFSEPTTNEGHLSREKATHLDFESFHRKLDIQLDELYVRLPIIRYII